MVDIDGVRAALRRAAVDRSAAALVATPDTVAEVSVAPGGRWVVRSHSIEWIGGPERLECWQVLTAGARPVTHAKPPGWIHPAVGILWPELLPIWGRMADSHRPDRLIDGAQGPGQLVLARVDRPQSAPEPAPDGCYLEIDPVRWLCLQLELPGKVWTLQEYHPSQ